MGNKIENSALCMVPLQMQKKKKDDGPFVMVKGIYKLLRQSVTPPFSPYSLLLLSFFSHSELESLAKKSCCTAIWYIGIISLNQHVHIVFARSSNRKHDHEA